MKKGPFSQCDEGQVLDGGGLYIGIVYNNNGNCLKLRDKGPLQKSARKSVAVGIWCGGTATVGAVPWYPTSVVGRAKKKSKKRW